MTTLEEMISIVQDLVRKYHNDIELLNQKIAIYNLKVSKHHFEGCWDDWEVFRRNGHILVSVTPGVSIMDMYYVVYVGESNIVGQYVDHIYVKSSLRSFDLVYISLKGSF